MSFIRSVMKTTEPFVERYGFVAEVDVEVSVMEVVEVIVIHKPLFAFGNQLVKSRMAQGRACPCMHQVENHVNWM